MRALQLLFLFGWLLARVDGSSQLYPPSLKRDRISSSVLSPASSSPSTAATSSLRLPSSLVRSYVRAKSISDAESCISFSSSPSSSSFSSSSSSSSSSSPSSSTAPSSLSSLVIRGGAVVPPPSSAAGQEQQLAAMLLVSAVVTLVFEFCCGHGIEFVKIVKQTSPDSYFNIVKSITSEKGISGVWDGFFPWGVLQSVGKGGSFGLAHAFLLPLCLNLSSKRLISAQAAKVLAGGLAGGVQGYVLSPTLLLKTRVMTDPAFRLKSPSGLDTLIKSVSVGATVVRNEGVLSLMKGSNVFALKRVFDWATRFWFADLLELLLSVIKAQLYGPAAATLTSYEKMWCSLLGGSVSAIATLPLDVLVAKIQDAKKAGQSGGAMRLIREDIQKGGVGKLLGKYMQGWEARTLHVGLTTVAMKTWTPLVYGALYGAKKKTEAA